MNTIIKIYNVKIYNYFTIDTIIVSESIITIVIKKNYSWYSMASLFSLL